MTMITVNALLTDGRSALWDLAGASPTGGFVRSKSVARTELVPGDVIRDCGAWTVVTDVRHNGIHGVTTAALLTAAGETLIRTFTSSDGADRRLDARIDPDSLYTLVSLCRCGTCGEMRTSEHAARCSALVSA
jgi:hypothetical protein